MHGELALPCSPIKPERHFPHECAVVLQPSRFSAIQVTPSLRKSVQFTTFKADVAVPIVEMSCAVNRGALMEVFETISPSSEAINSATREV